MEDGDWSGKKVAAPGDYLLRTPISILHPFLLVPAFADPSPAPAPGAILRAIRKSPPP
jgi:hypothetical protein